VVGAWPLVDRLDTVRQFEDAGCAAIVMHADGLVLFKQRRASERWHQGHPTRALSSWSAFDLQTLRQKLPADDDGLEASMGIFERVMHERQPMSESITLTPREAFAAIVVGAFSADGRVAPEEAARVNEIFSSTKLFRQPSAEPAKAVLDRVVELLGVHGADAIVALGAKALPTDLRAPAFAVAVDLVLADGEASVEERKFIDGLQDLLQIPDEDAMRIVDVIIVKNSV